MSWKSFWMYFSIIVSPSCFLIGQHEGDQWVIGYTGLEPHPDYGIMYIGFDEASPQFHEYPDFYHYLFGTASNICGKSGRPILTTNGMEIFSGDGETVVEAIAYESDPSSYWNYWYDEDYNTKGFPEPNGAIILPVPGIEDVFSIIYHSSEIHPPGYWQTSKILETRVQMLADSSFNVLHIDQPALPRHKWYTGTISATRHANGRDWWVVVFEENSPRYYSMLLTEDGINLHHEGEVDSIVLEGLGQAVFSSQGNYMARMDAITLEEGGQFVTLYAFDRCQGDLTRIATFQQDGGFFTGVAFSPSERFLYADNNLELWQWDLWAVDISSSKVLVDTFDWFEPPGWYYTTFGPMATAPDGRIYIVPSTGGSKYLHVIDRPDLPGKDCRFLQHHIELPAWNARSVPNIPNYRLGPLENSPCDTLGLDYSPVALWRHEPEDDFHWQTIRFTDLSYFDPLTWSWDFGDGHTSTERYPVHNYTPGLYEVCLTITNTNGADTYCQTVEILTTEVKDWLDQLPDLTVSPNPFNNEINIQSRSNEYRVVDLTLYDVHGKMIYTGLKTPVPATIHLPLLSPGMYYCRIAEKDGSIQNWKLMKQ